MVGATKVSFQTPGQRNTPQPAGATHTAPAHPRYTHRIYYSCTGHPPDPDATPRAPAEFSARFRRALGPQPPKYTKIIRITRSPGLGTIPLSIFLLEQPATRTAFPPRLLSTYFPGKTEAPAGNPVGPAALWPGCRGRAPNPGQPKTSNYHQRLPRCGLVPNANGRAWGGLIKTARRRKNPTNPHQHIYLQPPNHKTTETMSLQKTSGYLSESPSAAFPITFPAACGRRHLVWAPGRTWGNKACEHRNLGRELTNKVPTPGLRGEGFLLGVPQPAQSNKPKGGRNKQELYKAKRKKQEKGGTQGGTIPPTTAAQPKTPKP